MKVGEGSTCKLFKHLHFALQVIGKQLSSLLLEDQFTHWRETRLQYFYLTGNKVQQTESDSCLPYMLLQPIIW